MGPGGKTPLCGPNKVRLKPKHTRGSGGVASRSPALWETLGLGQGLQEVGTGSELLAPGQRNSEGPGKPLPW